MNSQMEGRTILKRALVIIGITIVLGYSYFELGDFVRGPRIIIESPISGYSTTTPAIVVLGRTIHTSNLSINGLITPVDLKGNFTSNLILAPGYNIIRVTARDNYKREVEKVIEIILTVDHLENNMSISTTTEATTPEFQMLNF